MAQLLPFVPVPALLGFILLALVPLRILAELVSIGTLLAFIIVCAGVLVLRYTHPELPRPFRTPGVPFVPILGILVYATYGMRHSKLATRSSTEQAEAPRPA